MWSQRKPPDGAQSPQRERMKQGTTIIRKKADQLPREIILRVNELLKTLRFGTVTLIIQDGRLVQIDKKDMVRLSKQ